MRLQTDWMLLTGERVLDDAIITQTTILICWIDNNSNDNDNDNYDDDDDDDNNNNNINNNNNN